MAKGGNEMDPHRLQATQLETRGSSAQLPDSLPNTLSEASVFSAESDDDADFLTGDLTRRHIVHMVIQLPCKLHVCS